MVVLDTCAIIEFGKSDRSFSTATLKKIEEGACVLSISFAEIACKLKFGKLEFKLPVRDFYDKFTEARHIEVIDNISAEDWFSAVEFDWPNKDPVDRLITAFAKKEKLPIVTTDRLIKDFYKYVIW